MSESIAIVYALREEIKPILKQSRIGTRILKGTAVLTRAEFCSVPIVFCQTGVGMANSREGVEHLLKYLRPSLLLSVGFAGGANNELKTGDLILPPEIRSETPTDRFITDEDARSELERLIREEQIPYQTGPLMTVEKIAAKGVKEEAGRKGMSAIDMETASIAAIAEKAKIPFVALRAVFDPFDEDLPITEPFENGRPITFLLQNPKMMLKAPKYARMNKVCQTNLARILSRFIDCYSVSPTEK